MASQPEPQQEEITRLPLSEKDQYSILLCKSLFAQFSHLPGIAAGLGIRLLFRLRRSWSNCRALKNSASLGAYAGIMFGQAYTSLILCEYSIQTLDTEFGRKFQDLLEFKSLPAVQALVMSDYRYIEGSRQIELHLKKRGSEIIDASIHPVLESEKEYIDFFQDQEEFDELEEEDQNNDL
jgi:hypothetical protein